MGLLGAGLFLKDPAWRGRVGVVINVEARGNQGPSYLFQTSAGDGKLVDLYARNVAHPAASSLYGEIYKYLPNDTDLTPFLQAGFAGVQFRLHRQCRGLPHRARPQRKSVARQPAKPGRQCAGADAGAGRRGFAGAERRRCDLSGYAGGAGCRACPCVFALPLAVTVFILIALAGWFSPRTRPQPRRPLAAILMPLLLLLGCCGGGLCAAGWRR